MMRVDRRHAVWMSSLLVMGLLLCGMPEAHADDSGSPSSILRKGEWAFGLDFAALVDRGLQFEGDVKGHIFKAGHYRGYGLTDWLSIYGRLGAGYLEVKDDVATNSFGAAFLFSTQLKARFWQNASKDMEWDGSIQYVHLRSRHRGDNEGEWNEGQFATSVAKAFGRVKPYVGIKLAVIDFDFTLRKNSEITKQGTYKHDGFVGPFIGTDVYFGRTEDVILTLESAYVDGADVNIALTHRF